ncbi:unnamed protein product [Musa acuminata var. zebrina]
MGVLWRVESIRLSGQGGGYDLIHCSSRNDFGLSGQGSSIVHLWGTSMKGGEILKVMVLLVRLTSTFLPWSGLVFKSTGSTASYTNQNQHFQDGASFTSSR